MPAFRSSRLATLAVLAAAALLPACASRGGSATDDHADHDTGAAAPASASASTPAGSGAAAQATGLPAGADDANARLAASPRHGEWAMIRAGSSDSVRAWVVYPERRDKAPVVLVVHEIFGLSNWIRAVADQFAAEGFIAIAPDLLTGKGVPDGPDGVNGDSARVAIRTLDQADVQRRLDAVARYGMVLPAALPRYGIVGFCWGGSVSFAHAVHAPSLGASVVYYGTSPATPQLASVRAPVLGLYGENDARVNSTIAPADSALKAQGKTYEPVIFPGAGHGFLRAQTGASGPANTEATKGAWPRTVAWFHKYLRG
ncbi:MAG: dienelactone hydrolase family protein [Gemmatimonadaceae bacterium]